MVAFGWFEGEHHGNIMYQGDLKECREYAREQDERIFHSLTICKDSGEIVEWIKTPARAIW